MDERNWTQTEKIMGRPFHEPIYIYGVHVGYRYFVCSFNFHFCGYVIIPPEHPFYSKTSNYINEKYPDITESAVCGLTFSKMSKISDFGGNIKRVFPKECPTEFPIFNPKGEERYMIGFDTAHHGTENYSLEGTLYKTQELARFVKEQGERNE